MTGPVEWLRRQLGPDAATRAALDEARAEAAELAGHVDALAYERDDLSDRLERAKQANADLRKNFRAAYEPQQVGECRKIRYLHREDAHEHAEDLARVQPGEVFHTYWCRLCPRYPRGGRPWHVAHCNDECADSVVLLLPERRVLQRGCGCASDVHTHAVVWTCTSHAEEVAS